MCVLFLICFQIQFLNDNIKIKGDCFFIRVPLVNMILYGDTDQQIGCFYFVLIFVLNILSHTHTTTTTTFVLFLFNF